MSDIDFVRWCTSAALGIGIGIYILAVWIGMAVRTFSRLRSPK